MTSLDYDDWDESRDHPTHRCRECDAEGASFSGEYDEIGEAVYLCVCCENGGHSSECECAELA